jgi:RHS repeat-associated protein
MKPILQLNQKAKRIRLIAVFAACSAFICCNRAFGQAPNISYGTPPAFTLNVAITPLTPTNSGSAVSVSGQTSTLAGGSIGYTDGTGGNARLNSPVGMVCDPAGNIYVTDADNHCIRKITPAGVVTTYAGIGGTNGAANGPAATATFYNPEGICMDAAGNLYVADYHNHLIRKITANGIVSTLAGNGTQGYNDGNAATAEFNGPMGVAVDGSGNVYVGDCGNNMIRKISPSGIVSTVAGNLNSGYADGTGSAVSFNGPKGLIFDRSGNLIVCDAYNSLIRSITPAGTVSTIAGTPQAAGYANGTGTAAKFNNPSAIAMDNAGNFYVADFYNNCVRMISPAMVVTTLSGTTGSGSGNGAGSAATFNHPYGVALDGSGNLYVSDFNNNSIRKVAYASYSLGSPLPAGLLFNSNTGTISGTPTAVTPSSTYTITAYGSTSNSTANVTLSVNASPLNLTNTQNYVTTYTPWTSGITSGATLSAASGDANQVATTVAYYDGLGRPLQTVQVKSAASGHDLVQAMAYDQFGREATKYLPYAATTMDGSYKTDALHSGAGVSYFYNPAGNGASGNQQSNGIVINPNPYAQTVFEPSPLNRVTEQGAPGTPWQPVANSTAGHTVKIAYTTNNSTSFAADSILGMQVARYDVTVNPNQTRTLVANGYYQANQLTVTVTRDENWVSGRAGSVEEYKDMEGHLILKRQYNYTGTAVQLLSTYYVYDDFGLLSFVLTPASGADAASAINQNTLDNLCYQYRYDERNRLIQKKIPGKGWEFMVYNTLDQVVMTQDANQRNQTPQQWTFSKYDQYGRIILTGMYTSPGSAKDGNIQNPDTSQWVTLRNLYKNTTNPKWEYRNSSNPTGYDELSDPLGHNYTYYTTTYYDNNTGIPGLPSTYTLTSGVSVMTTGLPVAKRTAVLNTPADQLWDVMYYDDLGRLTQSYAQHYLGGSPANTANYDLTTTAYNFTNRPISVTRQHYNTNSISYPQLTATTTYAYDQVGRKIRTWEQLQYGNNTSLPKTLISQIDYNEIGQVLNKRLHSIDNVNFLQNIAYTYNERGWLLTSSAPLFAMQLYYNTGSLKSYSGNIMFQFWGTPGNLNNYYSYRYDELNRLTSGWSPSGNNENIGYDQMGNVIWLTRYKSGSQIDALTYNYINAAGNTTNQLQTVADGSSSTAGLWTGTTTDTYDGNGNMLSSNNPATNNNQNKSITYNLLNLPQSVSVSTLTGGTSALTYTYDAAGNKLRRTSTGLNNTTDYIAGIQYDGQTTPALSFIQTEEGKAVYQPTTGGFDYTYYLGDNLGNTRVTFDTQSGSAVILQKDDYYPFGMEINTQVTNTKNEYLYNKKELQEEQQEYDYGARFYDPVIARWTTIDPLAEKNRRWNPYNYVKDNPIIRIDPDGMTDWIRSADGTVYYDKNKNESNLNKGETDISGKDVHTSDTKKWIHFNSDDSYNYIEKPGGLPVGPTQYAETGQGAKEFADDFAKAIVGAALIGTGGVAALELGAGVSTTTGVAAGAKAVDDAVTSEGTADAASGLKLNKQLASEQQMGENGDIIAGGNNKTPLRKAGDLANEYGGQASDWVKKTSSNSGAFSDGTSFETHWEENTATGERVNIKVKPGDIKTPSAQSLNPTDPNHP